jgi:Secretion system C-terminal sorting domain
MQRGLHVFDGIEKTLLTANRETEVYQLNVQVFPQPADDVLTISIQNNIGLDKIDVQLFDMQGKRIKQIKNMDLVNGKQSLSLDIQDISNGIYLLSILENGKVQNRKVVVQR